MTDIYAKPASAEKTANLNVRLPESLKTRLNALCVEKDISATLLVTRLIDQHLQAEGK